MIKKKRGRINFRDPNSRIYIILIILISFAVFGISVKTLPVISKIAKEEAAKSEIPENEEAFAKLKEVYEEEKGISLKNVSPRFSVFEDGIVGYRLAYPVSFDVVPKDNGEVEIVPKSGKGKIIVNVNNNGSFEVRLEGVGTNKKEADILIGTAEFIKSSFEFTQTSSFDQKQLQERFSRDTQGIEKY